MREIRFRGRSIGRKTPGEWVYGYFAKTYCPIYDNDPHAVDGTVTGWTEDCEIFNCEPGCRNNGGYWTSVDPDSVGQDTGFCDCLGTPIYEGDTLLLRGKLWEATVEIRVDVYYDSKKGCFAVRGKIDDQVQIDDESLAEFLDTKDEIRVLTK